MNINICRSLLYSMSQNAPGKHFRKGITMMELFKMFPDNKTAEKWFESRIWKNGRICPICKGHETREATHKTQPYRCPKCRRFFSVKKGTVMEASNISYQHWAIGTYLFATNLKGVSSMKIHRDLGITQKSAWFMVHRLRESWKSLAGVEKMDGPVEIDEVYLGGLEKNKHKDAKGKKEKVAVVGVKDRSTNKISAQPVPETTKARLEKFIEGTVEESSYNNTSKAASEFAKRAGVQYQPCKAVCKSTGNHWIKTADAFERAGVPFELAYI